MIRYLVPLADPLAASALADPLLARLRPAGPFAGVSLRGGAGCILTQVVAGHQPTDWTTWRPTAEGWQWSAPVPEQLPPIETLRRVVRHAHPLTLASGAQVLIRPAVLDGWALTLDDEPPTPASAYGRLALRIVDRVRSPDGIEHDDPELVELALLALQTCQRVTRESLLGVYRALSTADLPAIARLAILGPKAPAAGPGSPCGATASTPPA